MKFRKIEIENFRQFYGKQNITFSTNADKNVTLIHAENGTGKTAFLNAIFWCFFEDHTENFKLPDKLVNASAAAEGKKVCSVAIEYEDDGKIYLVERVKNEARSSFRVFEINNSYTQIAIDNPDSFVNSSTLR